MNARQLRRIVTPTMLLTAQSSPQVFHRLTDRLEEVLPQAKRCEIPDASHIMHEDNAPASTAAVQSFIEGHRHTS